MTGSSTLSASTRARDAHVQCKAAGGTVPMHRVLHEPSQGIVRACTGYCTCFRTPSKTDLCRNMLTGGSGVAGKGREVAKGIHRI